MLRHLLRKSLRDQRRALVGWSVGLTLLVFLEAGMWPTIRDMPDLRTLLANYPEPMRDLFGLQDFGTGTGFFNAELFSLVLPTLFIVFAIARGARAVAGEEERGTLDVVLVTPVSAGALVLAQAASVLIGAVALGAVLLVVAAAASVAFGMGIAAVELAGAVLAMVLLGVEFGWLALALGAATGRRSVAIGGASTAAVAAYVLYAAGQLVEVVRPWQALSPFDQAVAGVPIGAGLPLAYVWMPLAGAAVVAAALPVFDRRDIAVH
jgi:ABC-2 type transport system permease protein